MLKRLAVFPELTPEIVEAVDAQETPEVELQAHVAPKNILFRTCRELSLTNGEVACALSHLNCAKRIASGEDRIGLVLEDDALLSPDFGKAAVSAAMFLTEIQRPSAVLFSARTWVFGYALSACIDPGHLFRCSDGVGAYAYMLNQQGAHLLEETTLPLTAPFDHWAVRRSNGLVLYSVIPHQASFVGDSDDSYLRQGRLDKWNHDDALWWNRLRISRWFLRNFWPRRIDRLYRRIFLHGCFKDRTW